MVKRAGVKTMLKRAGPVLDLLALPVVALTAPVLWALVKGNHRLPRSRGLVDRIGVSLIRHHYYSPFVTKADITRPLEQERVIPSLDFNDQGQFALMEKFHFTDELQSIPMKKAAEDAYGYINDTFGPGDSETLYNMIRHFKPARIIEIGSGQSTLMARLAIERNIQDDSSYRCRHVCIEPFEQPWLERIGVEVLREKVEAIDPAIFKELEPNDILFIDSTHVIRPQGDVLYEYLYLLQIIPSGCFVHIHDIFTPRDYRSDWVLEERRLWNEQYLLEAFLSFNREFEVLCAMNWLWHRHPERLKQACPVLYHGGEREPASFWMRRL